jgi:hypothetical protein
MLFVMANCKTFANNWQIAKPWIRQWEGEEKDEG